MDALDVIRRQCRALQVTIGHLGRARVLLQDMEHESLTEVETLMARLQNESAEALAMMQRKVMR